MSTNSRLIIVACILFVCAAACEGQPQVKARSEGPRGPTPGLTCRGLC